MKGRGKGTTRRGGRGGKGRIAVCGYAYIHAYLRVYMRINAYVYEVYSICHICVCVRVKVHTWTHARRRDGEDAGCWNGGGGERKRERRIG